MAAGIDPLEAPPELPTAPRLEPGPDGGIAVLLAVQEVMTQLDAVGKDETHAQNFSYRAADAVVDAVAPLFATAGVVLVPHVQANPDRHVWDVIKRNGDIRTDALTTYTVSYALFSTEDGSSLHGQVITQGQGLTAYSPGAAMSYALKYFLSAALMIPFHDPKMELDSPEYRAEAEASQATKPQWWQVNGWASEEAHGKRRSRLLEQMKGLGDEHLRAAKRRFHSLSWADENSGEIITLWVPNREGRVDEKGGLSARIPAPTMDAADQWLAENEETRTAEVGGGEPFETPKLASGMPTVEELNQALVRNRVTPDELNAAIASRHDDHETAVELADWAAFVDEHPDRAAWAIAWLDSEGISRANNLKANGSTDDVEITAEMIKDALKTRRRTVKTLIAAIAGEGASFSSVADLAEDQEWARWAMGWIGADSVGASG